jgi:hypothetical protein
LIDTVANTEYFELVVWLSGQGPLRKLFAAPTLQEAIELAELTYGGCLVEVPPAAAAKPRLARSSTSPSVLKRLRNDHIRSVRSKKV